MLKVDLRLLERKRRLQIDEVVAPSDPLWERSSFRLAEPLIVQLEAQYAGRDVVIRGMLQTEVALFCRRCLVPVTARLDEEVTLLFRPGLSRLQAEEEEVHALPEGSDELDLTEAIQEQVMLSVPQYAMCEEACRGLCAQCGTNLNQEQCDCEAAEPDPRWAALRKLRTE